MALYHNLSGLPSSQRQHSLSSPSTEWIIQDISPICAPDSTCQMGVTSAVSSVKAFWDLQWKKKKTKKTNHKKLVSSFEFHENGACKLCVSVILNALGSWLQYYYSTWARWTKTATILFCTTFLVFFTNRSQNTLQKRRLMLFPLQTLFMLPSPLSKQKAQAKQQISVKVRNRTQELGGLFCTLNSRGNISQIEN